MKSKYTIDSASEIVVGFMAGDTMDLRIPAIHPISDLARDAKGVLAEARERQEPIVITQRGREVAVLLPIELYRELGSHRRARIVTPRLARQEDAELFKMRVTRLDPPREEPDASV
jgi:prevent-host-death family protein